MELKPEILEKIKALEEKYNVMGQDMSSYLDGLLYADYLTYWDYIHLDTLLSLQSPKTSFPDEKIFIMYHQITELYFKLVLLELEQISAQEKFDLKFTTERAKRVNRYFSALTSSFDMMVEGMDPKQFLKFRMSLLPASGFQSGQYRMIEISCTDMIQLVDHKVREEYSKGGKSIEEMYDLIYWKAGATELSSGKKTLTLLQFEEKYSEQFIKLAKRVEKNNLRAVFHHLEEAGEDVTELKKELRLIDVLVNINWPLAHYKSAVKYLQKDPEDIKATGGTNWQKYLPPRFQKRIFYPRLWSDEEQADWGKAWVKTEIFGLQG